MPQRSLSQRSGSLSRQSTADSDTDSALGSTLGAEPYRKSPKEYIIPISVEGGGYVTPRSGSLEPESQTSTPTSSNPPRTRFFRPKMMGSLLSDASEDESPFSPLLRYAFVRIKKFCSPSITEIIGYIKFFQGQRRSSPKAYA